MAKKSQEPLVIASKAKGVLKRAGCNTSGDAFMALNGYCTGCWSKRRSARRRTAARPCARTTSWLDPHDARSGPRGSPTGPAGLKVLAAPRSVGAAPQSGPRGRSDRGAARGHQRITRAQYRSYSDPNRLRSVGSS